MRVLQNTAPKPVGVLSFGRGGQVLVAGSHGGYDLWELETSSKRLLSLEKSSALYGCIYDPLGRWVYVSGGRNEFHLLPLNGGEVRLAPGSPYERHVVSFALTMDGERLFLSRGGGSMNRVECWEVRPDESFVPRWSLMDGKRISGNRSFLINQADWSTNDITVSHDGKTLATAESREEGLSSCRPHLVLRKGETGRHITDLGRSVTNFQVELELTPDAQTLFAWDSHRLERWDLLAGRQTTTITPPGRSFFRALAVHPSGRLVVTVSGDGKARYWDSTDLSLLQDQKCEIGKLHSVAISPDGHLIAAGGDHGKIALWNLLM